MLQVVFRGCDMNDVFFFPGIGGLDVKISLSKSYNYLQFTHNIRAFPWLVTLELQARKVKTSTPFFMSHDLEWTGTEATILELVVWNTRTISIYKRGPVCLRSKLWYRWWCQTRKTICFFARTINFLGTLIHISYIYLYIYFYIRTYIYIYIQRLLFLLLMVQNSCTSWYGDYPFVYRVFYIPGGCFGISAIK